MLKSINMLRSSPPRRAEGVHGGTGSPMKRIVSGANRQFPQELHALGEVFGC